MNRRSEKRRLCSYLMAVLILVACVHPAMAGTDWKAEQDAIFKEIPVKPGDVIDSSNWQKVQGLVPESILEWVKSGKIEMPIGAVNWAYKSDPDWFAASKKNAGKYALNESKSLIEAGTGNFPEYIYGEPFPEIDTQNDPDAGIKMMYNVQAQKDRHGIYQNDFIVDWVGAGGRERTMKANFMKYAFWQLPDGAVGNREKLSTMEMVKVVEPYDIAGMVTLNRRAIASKPDNYYAYIASIRRAKKLSGANRSDPFAGSDFTTDDANGWAGKNTSMKWKVLAEKIQLAPAAPAIMNQPVPARRQPDGSFKADVTEGNIICGYQVENPKGEMWSPQNMIWVPRKTYIVEAVPLDPYYNYGKMVYSIDPDVGIFTKVIWDRAGEYWKTMLCISMPAAYTYKGIEKVVFGNMLWYAMVDEKTKHACVANIWGKVRNYTLASTYMRRDLKPKMFTPGMMATISR